MKRRETREYAFLLLFQLNFCNEEEVDEQVRIFFEECPVELNEEETNFIKKEALGAYSNRNDIDILINKYAKDWETDRMPKVDLSILRLAVYEINYVEDIPSSVSANEAVELAKKYSSDEAPAFTNGIVGKIIEASAK